MHLSNVNERRKTTENSDSTDNEEQAAEAGPAAQPPLLDPQGVDSVDPELATRIHCPERRGVLRTVLETLGAHPLATGMLAVLGILGFLLSVFGFGIDRKEAADTTEQITHVDSNITKVAERLDSPCRIQPCLTIQEVVRVRTLGRPKDYLDARLPPAEDIRNGQYIYLISGCRIYIEYVNDVTKYVATDLYRYEPLPDGSHAKTACEFEVPRIIDFSSWDLSGDEYESDRYPNFHKSNLEITIKDMVLYRHDDIEIAQGCIECGNFSEPFVELFAFGPHAADFVDLYFTANNQDTTYETWKGFELALRTNFGQDLSEYDQLDASKFCNVDIWPAIEDASSMVVSRVGIGKGERGWKGPDVFSCLD
ncbi:hypothetical protein [Hyphococcus sp.]|uniref:hypothetical protein n=1 Tax=Hyphococcus sp. TaxID=2038636 RepID=UPI00207F3461|nr:MAG: hypothetical protein DHS20C04_06020 [Marinicaulis sp.]